MSASIIELHFAILVSHNFSEEETLTRRNPTGLVAFAPYNTHYSMRGYGEVKDIIQTLAVATAAAAIFCGWAVHYVHSLTP